MLYVAFALGIAIIHAHCTTTSQIKYCYHNPAHSVGWIPKISPQTFTNWVYMHRIAITLIISS